MLRVPHRLLLGCIKICSDRKVASKFLNWLLDQIPDIRYISQFAEYQLKPSVGLLKRAEAAIDVYECDILFVHRDAEGMPLDCRVAEIKNQLRDFPKTFVPVVPIRMTEAWLLVDEQAIRSAANNPNGKSTLNFPDISELENILNPKNVLFEMLTKASELSGRRKLKFRPETCRHRVVELINDFELLRKIPAFKSSRSNFTIL